MSHLVFLDTETVSITPGPATIWELALIERELPATSADSESLYQIRPDLHQADPGALKVGGYYERCKVRAHAAGSVWCIPVPGDEYQENEHIGSAELAGRLARTLSGAHLVAANPQFDAGHLAAFLRANGECLTADYHLIDIGSLVRGWAAGLGGVLLPFPLKVADAAHAAGIDPGRYDAHTALGDARLVRAVFDAVTGGAS